MPRGGNNRMPAEVKHRYFELIRSGLSGSEASQKVGVSLSCGSLWFIDAGQVEFIDTPVSPRFLSQDNRIEIADGLARGEPVKVIAARIGKSYQTIYREIAAHLQEIYGAEVSKQTITTITDRVMDGMAEWQLRPLDPA